MNILVTGGAGFIGANFVKYMLKNHNYKIVNLDALTYAGNINNLKDIEDHENYHFIKGNICDRNLVNKIFEDYLIDTVINFAAESHVDRSIEEPEIFLESNIMGTQVLLDASVKYWKANSDDKYSREFKSDVK